MDPGSRSLCSLVRDDIGGVAGPLFHNDADARRLSRGACRVRVMQIHPPSKTRGRRECRVKASPMARQQERKLAAGTTGGAGSSGIPCAMFDGLYALSSGTGLIAPVVRVMRNIIACATRKRCRRLGLSTGRPGPHDFTVRVGMFVGAKKLRCNPTRPPHPAPDVRDDARTSLCMGQDGASKT
jgi:hypothetical protein